MTARHRPAAERLGVEKLEDRTLPSSFLFTPIAGTPDGFLGFGEAPALNNGGTVAFLGYPDRPPRGRACLYTGSGGDLTTIACEGPLDVGLGSFPAINDAGTVAFVYSFRQVQNIATGDGGPIRILYSAQGGRFTSLGSPSLGNTGVVAFRATTASLSNPRGVFAGDGGPVTVIDSSGPLNIDDFGDFPSLNPSLRPPTEVAYLKRLFRATEAINIGTGGRPRTLFSTANGRFDSFGDPVLEVTGTVAFFATFEVGAGRLSGIFTGSGTSDLRAVAVEGNGFRGFASPPSINSAGTVAFLATLPGGDRGIFTGPDPRADKVIATGDELFGSTVTDVHFFRQGLNDAGQVAFQASLADGTSYIVRADPADVPGGGQRGGRGGAFTFVVEAGLGPVAGRPAFAGAPPERPRPAAPGSTVPATSAGAERVPLPPAQQRHAQDALFAVHQRPGAWEGPLGRLTGLELDLLAAELPARRDTGLPLGTLWEFP
jgi:hypothetical protein